MTTPSPRITDYSQLAVEADVNMFLEKRMEYSAGNLVYIGYSRQPNASTASLTWFIVKLTYSVSSPTRYQLPDSGVKFGYAWDDRATLFS